MKKWTAVFLGFAAVAIFLSLRERPHEAPGAAAPAEQVIERFSLEGYDGNGDKFWELEGDVAHVSPNSDVFIEKNVTLKIRDTTTIKSDKVYWRNAESQFLTRMPVEIRHEGHLVTGIGAVGRAADEYVQINRNIHMALENGVQVECDGPLQIYRAQKRAVFRRNVKIRDSKGTVDADRMDVYFDPETGRATRIEAKGNVVIHRAENVSHSDEAIYDTETQSIKLIGTPKLTVHEGDLKELNAARK
jgi:lipopolysaccharide export system protein LptA